MLRLRSAREIERMRSAGLVVWEAHEAAAALVRPGVTTAELDAAIEAVFQKYGAEPLFKGVPGKVPFPAATCTSVNEQVIHGIPGRRVLRDGDIVSLDTGCRLDGWCADAARTHPVGEVRPEAQKLLDVTRRTLELAIELLAVKRRWSEVAREMEKFVLDSGCSVVEAFAGHGVGRELHEAPSAPNFCSPATLSRDFTLQPGLVLAIEPMVNLGKKDLRLLGDHWTYVTADGRWSAHFEHTVALTAEGPRVLTGPPTDERTGS